MVRDGSSTEGKPHKIMKKNVVSLLIFSFVVSVDNSYTVLQPL